MLKFPALKSQQYAYSFGYDSDNYRYSSTGLSQYCHRFDTYGDGMIQHSNFYGVSVAETEDFLHSMSDYLLMHSEIDVKEFCEWSGPPDIRLFRFLASVKYRAGKPMYFSEDTQKVSSKDSLRHDKRYEEVPTWADGSFASVYRLAQKSFYHPLQRLELAIQIQEFIYVI